MARECNTGMRHAAGLLWRDGGVDPVVVARWAYGYRRNSFQVGSIPVTQATLCAHPLAMLPVIACRFVIQKSRWTAVAV